MERKTARISKEPEVRRQEILDTAMSVFMEKGYEAATMRDIAAAMQIFDKEKRDNKLSLFSRFQIGDDQISLLTLAALPVRPRR